MSLNINESSSNKRSVILKLFKTSFIWAEELDSSTSTTYRIIRWFVNKYNNNNNNNNNNIIIINVTYTTAVWWCG
jgi:hypothetical protein